MSYEKMDHSIIPPRLDNRHYPVGTVLGEFFYIGDKPGGVEPGFLGVKINPAFQRRLSAAMPGVFKENMSIEEVRGTLKNLVDAPFSDRYRELQKFSAQIEKEGKTGTLMVPGSEKIDLWLIKQDYNDTPSGKVSPPKDRLEKTNAIKSLPSFVKSPATLVYEKIRLSDPEVENTNAVLEYFANSVAKAYGMKVQEQELAFGRYANGKPKIMTACKWEPGLKVFEGKLRGSVKKDLYQGHLVQFENGEAKTINNRFIADDGIKDLGESLALVISQGDRDVLGSQGQNKGQLNDRFFGFDFGHAYREKNPILDSLRNDFTFVQPEDSNKKFKNISVFYDALMSEKMMGMLYLYRMDPDAAGKVFSTQERSTIEKMIEVYSAHSPAFAERINRIQPIDTVCDKVKSELSARTNQNMLFDQYVHEVDDAYQRATYAHQTMFKIFRQKMMLGPQEIDALDNLNKLSNPTSILSGDGKVVLAHLRIMPTDKPAIVWQVSHQDGNLVFQCEPPARREEAYHLFQNYVANLRDKTGADSFKITPEGIKVPAEMLPQFSKLLDESAILTHKKQVAPAHHPKAAYMPREASNYFSSSINVLIESGEDVAKSPDSLQNSRESIPDEFEEDLLEDSIDLNNNNYSSNNNNNNLADDIFSFTSSSSSSAHNMSHEVDHTDWHHPSFLQGTHQLQPHPQELEHEVSSKFKKQIQKMVGVEKKPIALSDLEEHEDESEGESETGSAKINH